MKTNIYFGIILRLRPFITNCHGRNFFLASITSALLVFSGTAQTQTNTFIQGINTVLSYYDPTAGDVDGDGDLDLVVEDANYGYSHVYINDGTGSFTDLGAIPGIKLEGKAFGDLDGDGDADLVVPYNAANGITRGEIWLCNGNGTFSLSPITCIPTGNNYGFATKIYDINQDGKNDIIYIGIGDVSGYHSEVWLNTGTTGSPAFTLSTTFSNYVQRTSADFGDIDNDGDIDIVSGGRSWGAEIYINNNGTFTPTTYINEYAAYVDLTDWDQDGDLDLLRYDSYNNSGLYLNRNDGIGNFENPGTLLFNNVEVGYPLTYSGWGFMLVDVNNDGFKDAVIGPLNGAPGTRVLLNTGCSFVMQNYNLASGASYGMVNADFNGDGFKDVFSGSYVFRNDLLLGIPVPLSNITSTTGASIPSGNSATLSAVASNGGTARWWDAANSGSLIGTGPSYTTPVLTIGTTYYVSAVNSNGCESARIAVNTSIVSCTPASITACPSNQQPVMVAGCSATASYSVTASGSPSPVISYAFTGATISNGSGDGSGSTFNIGVTNVTVSASNSCGSAVCTFTVKVEDHNAPIITGVGANSVISCPSAPAFSSPIASDACGSASLTYSDVSINGNCAGRYSITRTWTATDLSGNTSTASQTISVTDNTAPVISGVGANQTITSPATLVWSTPIAADACGTSTLSNTTTNIVSGTSTIYIRTWTATDECVNQSSASQTITVTAPITVGCDSCGPNKVSVCHKAGKASKTLCIASSALAAHLAHGDVCGPCAQARMASGETESTFETSFQNFPEPFSSKTTIRFTLKENTWLTLEIFDMLGRKINTLFNDEVEGGKEYSLEVDGTNLPKGMYIYRGFTPENLFTGKMLLIKD